MKVITVLLTSVALAVSFGIPSKGHACEDYVPNPYTILPSPSLYEDAQDVVVVSLLTSDYVPSADKFVQARSTGVEMVQLKIEKVYKGQRTPGDVITIGWKFGSSVSCKSPPLYYFMQSKNTDGSLEFDKPSFLMYIQPDFQTDRNAGYSLFVKSEGGQKKASLSDTIAYGNEVMARHVGMQSNSQLHATSTNQAEPSPATATSIQTLLAQVVSLLKQLLLLQSLQR